MFLLLFFGNLLLGSLILLGLVHNHFWAAALCLLVQLLLASFFSWTWHRDGNTHLGTSALPSKLPTPVQPWTILLVTNLLGSMAVLYFDIGSAKLH